MNLDPLFHHGTEYEVKQPKGQRGFNWPFLLLIFLDFAIWFGLLSRGGR